MLFRSLAGLVLALAGVFLEQQTGDAVYDGVAALLIGTMLMAFAVALAWENKRLILGESLPERDERALYDIVAGWDDVDEVVDFRTVYFGPERVVVSADVEFHPGLSGAAVDERITAMENAMIDANDSVHKVYVEPEV